MSQHSLQSLLCVECSNYTCRLACALPYAWNSRKMHYAILAGKRCIQKMHMAYPHAWTQHTFLSGGKAQGMKALHKYVECEQSKYNITSSKMPKQQDTKARHIRELLRVACAKPKQWPQSALGYQAYHLVSILHAEDFHCLQFYAFSTHGQSFRQISPGTPWCSLLLG